MSHNSESHELDWRGRALALERGWVITAAVVAILFGLFVLLRPQAGLLTVAVVFGIYLVVSGVSRVAFAIADGSRSTGYRWLSAILGLLIVVAGFICLFNLFQSLAVLGFTLGIGLILAGIVDLFNFDREGGRPTWLRITGGILSIIAGIVMFVVPFFSVGLIVLMSAIVLIVVGIVALFRIPGTERDDLYEFSV
jgi:uncharacterized membrane protein HdeD (DUF308 family)